MRNVALVGKMGAGKTTLADGLIEVGYNRLSLAGPLKEISARVYGPIEKGASYETADRLTGEPVIKSGRQILQEVGQYMKYVDRDFWVKAALSTAQRHTESSDAPLVCEDTRFIFEAEAFRNAGWIIVGIETPEDVRMERYERLYGREPTPQEMNHESEIEVPMILEGVDLLVNGTADVGETVRLIIGAASGS